MREGLRKYDILEYLKTLLGSDNAWRTSAELGKHFDTDSNQVAQLLFPLRSDGLVITRNRVGTGGVREVMVSETGQVAQRGRKAPRVVEIRRPQDIQVPVVEVAKTEARGKTEDAPAAAAAEQAPEVVDAPPATPAEPVVLQVQAGPFEPAANGGGAVVISSAPVKEDPDPLASELDALENTLARGKRAPAVVSRKDEKQRVLFELARRIEPAAPLTAFLLRQVVHDLERPA
jgi:hypothetical protein